jgi:hypothetical protein
MSVKIQGEHAIKIIELSFLPFECKAEKWDNGDRIRFRVFNESEDPILSVDEFIRKQFSDPKRFESIILQCRKELKDKACSLSDWKFKLDP